MSKKLAKKVLLIGWDAADWKIINPLMNSGMMPALESIVNNGVIGNIATLDPPLSPMLWTSISTGKYADQHGILGFMEPAPEGKGIRPIMITSRKVKAIWNMLSQSGFKTHVIGWWPSHPAEPINGIAISDFFQKETGPLENEWKMPAGTVHPQEKENIFKELRVHPGELTEAHIIPFVPDAAKVDQNVDKRLGGIAKVTAHCSSIHAAATYILENEEWDFVAVYFDAIDHYSHGFMNFHPPRMEHVPEETFNLYKDVVSGGYIYHDMMLQRLLELAGDDTTVILMSDHGFHSDHLRPKNIPDEPAGPAWEHRTYGIFCMKGPGIKKDERVYGTTLLDIVPTILTLFGLPVGEDMPGKPVHQAFEEVPEISLIKSWEDIPGESGMHPADIQRDPIAEHAAMQQLIELGYIEKPDEDMQKTVDSTVNESKFYLARVYLDQQKLSLALPLLEDLYIREPGMVRYAFRLAKCLLELGKIERANDIVEKVIENEKTEYPQLFLLKGILELLKKNNNTALEYLNKAESMDPNIQLLYQQIGMAYMNMRKFDDAERAFNKALEKDPENVHAYFGLAQVFIRIKEYEAAADNALNAIGLLYHFPQAHLLLGIALTRLGMFDKAAEAFEISLRLAPGLIDAHKYLAYIYHIKLKDQGKADFHLEAIKRLNKKLVKESEARSQE